MISRWKPATLSRSITNSVHASFPEYPATAGALQIATHGALSTRAREDAEEEKPPKNVAANSSSDPWAPIFDDISTAEPLVHSPRSHLPARFFTSRPSPKTFFSSNMSRNSAASGSGRREYGTDAHQRDSHSSTSLDKGGRLSAWDHIFEGVDDEPSIGAFSTHGALASPAFSSARRPKRTRPTMTAREISAFDKMFDMIFTAVSDKRKEPFTTAAVQVPSTSRQPYNDVDGEPEPSSYSDVHADASGSPVPPEAEAASSTSAQVGLPPPGEAFDLFGRLRRQSNRMRQTSATAERLDRQKEEAELCETDQQLLEWTVREVFQGDHIPESAPPPPPSSSSQTSEEIARYIANPTYPHLLAHVMHTFRTKYHDPHTALALFTHAKRRSIHSYVFGCTAPAYNELLEARWELDGALKGVEEALVEMRANGVRPDKGTRAFVERVRREVGERLLSRRGVDLDGGVWEVLERVEALVTSRKKSERGGEGGKGGGVSERSRNSKLEAKKRHWNEEWKMEDTGPFRLGEDRLTLS